jgi:HSP20 family molecular chaperone IbpA
MSLLSSLLPSLVPSSAPAAPGSAPSRRADDEPALTPRHELSESAEAYGLTVDLPGVAREGLELSVDHQQIRVLARRAWRRPEAWTRLHRESRDGAFELVLEHGRTIDADKVHAELRDGVLRVSLPKAEGLKPRRIAVA